MQSTMAKEIWHHQKPVSPIAKPEYSTIAKAQEKKSQNQLYGDDSRPYRVNG